MSEPNTEADRSHKSCGQLIYVVDDEPALLELASIILEPLGYMVKTFSSSESALRSFEAAESKPALIITDYAMHEMNGLDLTASCRQIRPNQKVLLVTGTVGADVCEAAPTKPDRFLSKPYQPKDLIDAATAILAA